MTCLEQILCGDRTIIGIKDYKECSNPESNLWINELPGMSLKKGANITPEQWQTGNDFLKSCIRMAIRHVFDEFSAELQPYFDFTSIIETRKINKFSTANIIPALAAERGIIVKRWRSEVARLYTYELYVNVVQAGDTIIKVIDGSETTEFPVTLVAGQNTVAINYKAEQEQIKFVFDQTLFDTYNCSVNLGYDDVFCNSCGGNSSDKHIYVAGWDGTKEVTNNCFGIGILVTSQCYEENILCMLLPKMYFLIWYKAGIMVSKEHVNTDRINNIATFGKERAEKNLEEYEVEYKAKYSILIKNAYNFLRTTKGECITCNGNRYVQTTP